MNGQKNEESSHHIVVVPDGLTALNGQALPEPSFVYRAVLDAAARRPPQDIILLAPANSFGGAVTEEEAAERYLRIKGRSGPILRPPPVKDGYVDTRGNARHLREWLQSQQSWPLARTRLLVAERHARRALLCFRREGFTFQAVESIGYVVPNGEMVVPRLWYYRWPLLHRLYEFLAYVRDWLRPASF
ncbi:MAG TPA: hypothetical protein VJ750_13670 [Rhizomicrobium sp.]|nr:hypothetical protein [Rhizomicrobium sp.]